MYTKTDAHVYAMLGIYIIRCLYVYLGMPYMQITQIILMRMRTRKHAIYTSLLGVSAYLKFS